MRPAYSGLEIMKMRSLSEEYGAGRARPVEGKQFYTTHPWIENPHQVHAWISICLLYTSDAADE